MELDETGKKKYLFSSESPIQGFLKPEQIFTIVNICINSIAYVHSISVKAKVS